MSLIKADGVVVVVVEERLLNPTNERIILLSLFLGQVSNQRSLIIISCSLLSQPSRHSVLSPIDRYRALHRSRQPLLLLPLTGAYCFECLNDIPKAPFYKFLHLYNPMKMIGHTHAVMHHDTIPMHRLCLRCLHPRLFHDLSQRSERESITPHQRILSSFG